MRSLFLALIFVFLGMPLTAEVGVLSVTSEDVHTQKEDFWHTFEYYVVNKNKRANKCQATRVGRKWFATAAHCVEAFCKEECTLRIDLLEQPYSIFASVEHTSRKPLVFVHPGYDASTPVVNDFALLKIDLSHADIRYYRRAQEIGDKNAFVSHAQFNAFIRKNPVARREFEQALRPQLPALLVFGNKDVRVDRDLSVISIFDGRRQIMHDPYPTDYVQALGFAYTRNFGIREGMSGSGVMTNTGELAGIISGYLVINTGKENPKEYFMFPVFDQNLTSFMESVMGSDYYKLDRHDASAGYTQKSTANHEEIIKAMQALSKERRSAGK